MMTSNKTFNTEMIHNDDGLLGENEIDLMTSLAIEIIGEILINRSITVKQICDGFKINNAAKIIKYLLAESCIEVVPESNPKAYRLKEDINEWFMPEE
jgi:hypothetical protein